MSASSHDINDIDEVLDYEDSNPSTERTDESSEPDTSSFKDLLYSLQQNMTAQTAMLFTLVAERRGEKRTSSSDAASSSKRRKHHIVPRIGYTEKPSEKATTSASKEATHSASEKAKSSVSESDNNEHSNESNDDRLSIHGQSNDPEFTGSVSEVEDNTSLLTEIDQALGPSKDHGPQVNEKLSQLVNTKFVMELDLEKRKQLAEKYKTPKNCEALFVPKVNPEIWGKLNAISKQRDIKMSNLQDLLIRVSNYIVICQLTHF